MDGDILLIKKTVGAKGLNICQAKLAADLLESPLFQVISIENQARPAVHWFLNVLAPTAQKTTRVLPSAPADADLMIQTGPPALHSLTAHRQGKTC